MIQHNMWPNRDSRALPFKPQRFYRSTQYTYTHSVHTHTLTTEHSQWMCSVTDLETKSRHIDVNFFWSSLILHIHTLTQTQSCKMCRYKCLNLISIIYSINYSPDHTNAHTNRQEATKKERKVENFETTDTQTNIVWHYWNELTKMSKRSTLITSISCIYKYTYTLYIYYMHSIFNENNKHI